MRPHKQLQQKSLPAAVTLPTIEQSDRLITKLKSIQKGQNKTLCTIVLNRQKIIMKIQNIDLPF
jgi:hypothetical protein